jgi:hypothetical protein
VRRRSRRARLTRVAIVTLIVALVAAPLWSLGGTLLANNTDPLGLRVVEWARDHHLAGLVNKIENYWYTHHPPPRGGTPKGGLPSVPAPVPNVAEYAPPTTAKSEGTPTTAKSEPIPTPIVAIAAPALPGEGAWKPVGREVAGQPAAWVTYLRPDAIHTSELIGVVHFDMRHLTATLHAGTDVPGGGPWQHGSRIDPADYSRVVGAFNSAFKLSGSHGGYYAEGRMVAPLQAGVASLVVYRDGHANVALWARDAVMTSQVSSVRQNLVLLVDNGQLAPDLTSNYLWGATVGSAVYVWRSAVCVDRNNDLIYAAGPALNVATLAEVMQRAGCLRAMELDINSWWVSLMTYTPNGHGGVTPWKLLPSMVRSADRYLLAGTRDFLELDAR